MHESRRAFVHVSEVTRAFDLRESDFKHANSGWVYRIKREFWPPCGSVHSSLFDVT